MSGSLNRMLEDILTEVCYWKGQNMNEMKFDLKLEEVSVKITDVNGVENSYILRELDGVGKSTFLDDFTRRAVRDANGNITKNLMEVKGFQEGLITLLSLIHI